MAQSMAAMVEEIVRQVRVTDMHTHLFPPAFGSLAVSGADHVLTYHYLIAEAMRQGRPDYAGFWRRTTAEQAQWIWDRLFQEATPLSEAASGVLEIGRAFGVDVAREGLSGLRRALVADADDDYVARVMDMAGVEAVVMTNDPFDDAERALWQAGADPGRRFHAALRLDTLLNQFGAARQRLAVLGYPVRDALDAASRERLGQFLREWSERMQPVYFALSAPPTFTYPGSSPADRILAEVVLPLLADLNRPLALMIGARRGVNPALGPAGDSTGSASVAALERLAADFPQNRFFVTLLSREDQHALAVAARKFGNLMPFGCWWFLNTESLVREITRLRLELIGPTFVAQHSDARVLEHLLYKWARARAAVADVLSERYQTLARAGWPVTRETVRRDAEALLGGNFWAFAIPESAR